MLYARVHTLKWDIWLPWIAQNKSSNRNIFHGRDIKSLVYLIIALRFSIIVRWFGWRNNTFFPFWLRFLVVLKWFWWDKILFTYFWYLIVLIGKQILLIIMKNMMMIIIRTLISTSRFKDPIYRLGLNCCRVVVHDQAMSACHDAQLLGFGWCKDNCN